MWKYLKKGGERMRKDMGKIWHDDKDDNYGNVRPEKVRMDKMILSEKLQIERKQFFFDFKENASGRFLRITEEVGGHRDTIIVPATGLQIFRESLDHIIAVNAKTQAS
jgi:hypothetical protein